MAEPLESKSSFINIAGKTEPEKEYKPELEGLMVLNRPHFTFRLHMLLVFLTISILSVAIIIGSAVAINRIQKKLYFVQISERYLFEVAQARRWEKNYFLYNTNLEDAVQSVGNAKIFLSKEIDKLISILSSDETVILINHLDKYEALLHELTILDKNGIKDTEKQDWIENSLRKHGAEMVEVAADLVYKEQNSMNAMLDLLQIIPIYSFVIVLFLTTLLAWFFLKRLITPLNLLVRRTQDIAKGDFSPIAPICKYDSEFTGVEIAINQMIKELKSRERAMVESHKLRAIGTLTAGVAHELNNPLNNIMLTAHSLLEDHKDLSEEELLEMLNDLIGEADRSRSIIHNLLDFARESESVSEPLDLGVLVNATIKLALNQAKVSGARMSTEIEPDLPRIRGDKQQLKQVFLNLILNAVDAVEKNGKIKISVKKSDVPKFLAVQIEDNGCGIPEHILPNIFDPFFTTKEQGKGTGLGLSVSHGIVVMHGGQISIETKKGEYTKFTVMLPSREVPADLSKT